MAERTFFSLQPSTRSQDRLASRHVHSVNKNSSNLNAVWIHWRWLILFFGVAGVGLETYEHLVFQSSPAMYYLEVLIDVLVVVGAIFLIQKLHNVLEAKTAATQLLEQKHILGKQFSLTQDINELTRQMATYAVNTAHAAGANVFVYDSHQGQLTLAAQAGFDHRAIENARLHFDTDDCLVCVAKSRGAPYPLQQCRLCERSLLHDASQAVCLPLTHGTGLVGTLHLYGSAEKEFIPEKIGFLNDISDEMASAVKVGIEKKAREVMQLAQAVDAVQLDLARDLHDTIGQNISYLRLKLDQLAEYNHQADLSKDLKSMSQAANESYDIMRGMLSVLKSGSSTDLLRLLTRYIEQVEERTEIQFTYNIQGSPTALPQKHMLQLFYVFREAISNCEKYAQASQVKVFLSWEKDEIILMIEDNGIGFDPAQVEKEKHYGLDFMRSRMEQLNGVFALQSQAGAGTQITLHMPYPSQEP